MPFDVTILLYFLLLGACLLISFQKRRENKFPFYIYFLIVAVIEILCMFLDPDGKNLTYLIGSFLYVPFFTLYYSNLIPQFRKVLYALGGGSILAMVYFIYESPHIFPVEVGVIISLTYATFALIWFSYHLKNMEKVFIAQMQGFWVSAAILFWGIIFLFRVTLMYYLQTHDPEFLLLLHQIFKVSILITYVFFLISVTRKQKPAV
ncbi:hypothetical protein RCH13_000914 [Chryseobacterium sp. MP_3.2]|nr:hypothetical protein [Chryseobacterium sp. MP_3.2]